jgi:hypothetical protein
MTEGTKIMICSCSHEFQDSVYGKGMRVHNVNTKGQAFCTVCSPSYRREKQGKNEPASPVFGHGILVARGNRNPKNALV